MSWRASVLWTWETRSQNPRAYSALPSTGASNSLAPACPQAGHHAVAFGDEPHPAELDRHVWKAGDGGAGEASPDAVAHLQEGHAGAWPRPLQAPRRVAAGDTGADDRDVDLAQGDVSHGCEPASSWRESPGRFHGSTQVGFAFPVP